MGTDGKLFMGLYILHMKQNSNLYVMNKNQNHILVINEDNDVATQIEDFKLLLTNHYRLKNYSKRMVERKAKRAKYLRGELNGNN